MTVFAIIGGLLIVGALLLALAPLLQRAPAAAGATRSVALVAVYRDQLREVDADVNADVLSRERHGEARGEIESRLLADLGEEEGGSPRPGGKRYRAAGITGALLTFATVSLYFIVGNPLALAPGAALSERSPHGLDTRQVEAMIGRLAARLQQDPEDADGWVMLARSYTALRRYEEAARAYAGAATRRPADAELLADYADLLAMAQGRTLRGEPEKIIARALAVDPSNVKALALAGSAAFEKREYAGALSYWERLLPLVPPESAYGRSIRGSIAQARALAASPSGGNAP